MLQPGIDGEMTATSVNPEGTSMLAEPSDCEPPEFVKVSVYEPVDPGAARPGVMETV